MYVGVDGCPAGWFVARYDGTRLDFAVVEEFATVVDESADAERLFVDMPIGLPDSGRRACDEAARKRMGARASTVFFAPCRAALDADDHAAASETNREHTGYGLSIQAWHLVPKIRAVDRVLRRDRDAREPVVESHPELCYRAFAGGTPVAEPKSTAEGRRVRIDLLDARLPDADVERAYEAALDGSLRREVGRDDVLDAFALALAASMPSERLPPGSPPTDAAGLPMTITAPAPSQSPGRP